MRSKHPVFACTLGLLLSIATFTAEPQTPPPSMEKPPVASVPQLMTLEGEFVRIAYNNEGYVTLGYRTANYSVNQPWMLLEVGVTLREKVKTQVLKRDAFSVKTPDGKLVPMATEKEYSAEDLRGVQMMANYSRDSIGYWPTGNLQGCRLGFFSDIDSPAPAYDQVELNSQRGCLGRLYFHIPGGVKTGQHWLIVKFATSTIEVPFRVLTKEEEKYLRKNWEGIKKDYDASPK